MQRQFTRQLRELETWPGRNVRRDAANGNALELKLAIHQRTMPTGRSRPRAKRGFGPRDLYPQLQPFTPRRQQERDELASHYQNSSNTGTSF